jgi:Tol biopolymer transport system component
MRRSTHGGAAETILYEPEDMDWGYACGSQPGSSCVLAQVEAGNVVFYSLDAIRGKEARLGQVALSFGSSYTQSNISPDGSRVAYATDEGRIKILSVRDRTWHDIPLGSEWQHLRTLAWAPDGNSLFVTCWFPDSSDLIRVTLNGKVTRLVHNGHNQWQWLANPLPSPNGKYLAFQARTWDSNVWMLENF